MTSNKKSVSNINHQQKSTLELEKITNKISKMLEREFLVAFLFLVGSILFFFDGLIQLAEGISIHAVLLLPASLMFVVGSYLFMPTDKNN